MFSPERPETDKGGISENASPSLHDSEAAHAVWTGGAFFVLEMKYRIEGEFLKIEHREGESNYKVWYKDDDSNVHWLNVDDTALHIKQSEEAIILGLRKKLLGATNQQNIKTIKYEISIHTILFLWSEMFAAYCRGESLSRFFTKSSSTLQPIENEVLSALKLELRNLYDASWEDFRRSFVESLNAENQKATEFAITHPGGRRIIDIYHLRSPLYREHAKRTGKDFLSVFDEIIKPHCQFIGNELKALIIKLFYERYRVSLDRIRGDISAYVASTGRPKDFHSHLYSDSWVLWLITNEILQSSGG